MGDPSPEVGQGQGKVAESRGEVRELSLEVGQRVREASSGQKRGYGRPERRAGEECSPQHGSHVGVVCLCNRRPRGTSHREAAREWSEVRRLLPREERRGLAAEGVGPSPVGRGVGGA